MRDFSVIAKALIESAINVIADDSEVSIHPVVTITSNDYLSVWLSGDALTNICKITNTSSDNPVTYRKYWRLIKYHDNFWIRPY